MHKTQAMDLFPRELVTEESLKLDRWVVCYKRELGAK